MKKTFVKIFFTTIFSISLFSCNTSMGSVVDDYNSNFIIDYSNSTTSDMLSPGDEGFNPSMMLKDEYFVGSDSTLNIFAPTKSHSQEWMVMDPLTDEPIPVKLFGNNYEQYVATGKVFSINARDCGLEEGRTYKLQLKVTDQGGLRYTDVCAIVVYKRYNFN